MSSRHVITFRYPAPDGVLFAPNAFNHRVGQHIDVSFDFGGGPVRHAGALHSVKVDEDGSGALLVMEVQDDDA